MEEQATQQLISSLQQHVRYLASDSLEGRRSGTAGERLAMQYIEKEYREIGLLPAGDNGFEQAFPINEGRSYQNSRFVVGGQTLVQGDDYFPLSFSAQKKAAGNASLAMSEPGQPWFMDVKDTVEAYHNNPHFDMLASLREAAIRSAARGATALLVYNTAGLVDNIDFNKFDTAAPVPIPVLYITPQAIHRYFTDNTASFDLDASVVFDQHTRMAHNLAAWIDNGAATTVILGAHYDHLGYGEDHTALDTVHQVHNGADDNASGTAALLELARMLKNKAPRHNNYLILHFSGEEQGLLGSKYWLANPTRKIKPNYMVNMDMVGRYDTSRSLTLGGYGTAPQWDRLLKADPGPLKIHTDSTGSGPSDHAAFYLKNIPTLFLFTGSHRDYHKATDDWDKVNYPGMATIVKTVYHWLGTADTMGVFQFERTANPVQEERRSFTVSLGVIPDYSYSGEGMRIDGISPGKLAEKIGLQGGDIVLQLGAYRFQDMRSYMQALGHFKKGDATTVLIRRGKEEKLFNLVF